MTTGLEIDNHNIQKQIAFNLSRLVLQLETLNKTLERIADHTQRIGGV